MELEEYGFETVATLENWLTKPDFRVRAIST